jgi:hypothetical protein
MVRQSEYETRKTMIIVIITVSFAHLSHKEFIVRYSVTNNVLTQNI